jgi:Zn-dependent protease
MMIAAGLLVHVSTSLPAYIARWFLINLINALQINAVLAIFNLLPIPPLDGSRILVGLLPGIFAVPFARLEQYGMLILIGMLFILPILGQQIGMNLNVFAWIVGIPANALLGSILHLTGNT